MDREASIKAKIADIEGQIAYAERVGWNEKADRQRERLSLLKRAARMKPETAWKRALENGVRFVEGGGREALEDALLYAYASTGRGLGEAELLAAVAEHLSKYGSKKGNK